MSDNNKLYDTSTLKEMVGDDEEVERLLKLFLESTPEILAELNQGYEKGNIEQTARNAHKMKASLDMLKIRPLYDVIRKVDKPYKVEQNSKEMPDLVKTINSTLNTVFEQIRKDYSL